MRQPVVRDAERRRDVAHILLLAATLFLLLTIFTPVSADVPAPSRKELFRADTAADKRARSKALKEVLRVDRGQSADLDVKAPEVKYDKESGTITASGGVVLSRQGVQAEANTVQVKSNSNEAVLKGDVAITGPDGSYRGDEVRFNFENETGKFSQARLALEDGGFSIVADKADKISEFEYELEDCTFSTCHCADGKFPWSVSARRAHITQDSYAYTYNSTFDVYGVPILYSPFAAFPVKQRRASGLLPPRFGYSSQDGFDFRQPIFIVPDDSSDILLTPFISTNTRAGAELEYRNKLSTRHDIDGHFVYSNESKRGDELRGTVTTDLFDPTFDENRVGIGYRQNWRSAPNKDFSSAVIADVHYISDDLMLRELDIGDIGDPTDRYTTSAVAARFTLGSSVLGQLGAEYNQSLEADDDLIFQRLPEASLIASKTLRPFGFNPYGLKLVSRGRVFATAFQRDTGYDGTRVELRPSVGVPFHVQNFLDGALEATLSHSKYRLNDREDPGQCGVGGDPKACAELPGSPNRTVPVLGARIGTGVERVYELEPDSWLTRLTRIGASDADRELRRVKHTIEPSIRYTYVPSVQQDDIPLFDSNDRIRARSLVVYGFETHLYGRFVSSHESSQEIRELTPHVDELAVPRFEGSLPEFGYDGDSMRIEDSTLSRTRGLLRDLASLEVKQGYDAREDQNNTEPDRSAFTDISTTLKLFPTENFGLAFEGNLSPDTGDLSSWAVRTQLLDDRGDALRARYTFIDQSVSQIEGNAELVLTDRLRLGYYGRYDEEGSQFIENRGALRFSSSCNCWSVDIGFSEKINPDRNVVSVVLTLAGLGNVAQALSLEPTEQNQ